MPWQTPSVQTEDVNGTKSPVSPGGDDLSSEVADAVSAWDEFQTPAGGRVKLTRGEHTTDASVELQDGMALVGESVGASTVTAGSSLPDGDPLITYRTDSGAPGAKFFAAMAWLRVDGRDGEGPNVKGFEAVRDDASDEPNDFTCKNVIFRDTAQEAILLNPGTGWGYRFEDILVEGCGRNATNAAVYLRGGASFYRNFFVAYNKAAYGYQIHKRRSQHKNIYIYQNEKHGGLIQNGNQLISNLRVIGNGQAATNAYRGFRILNGGNNVISGAYFDGESQTLSGLQIQTDANIISNAVFKNHATDIEVSGNDNEFWGCVASSVDDTGVRNKWDGVIGGGPLGGTDIGSLTGASPGEYARADGTTATTADTLWCYNGSDWVRVDGGSTITPA